MWLFSREKRAEIEPGRAVERLRAKYVSFRELLSLNNESLELMAGIQEDLQYAPPRREVLGDRMEAIFTRINGTVASLQNLTGRAQQQLMAAAADQQREIERYLAGQETSTGRRLTAPLSDIFADSEAEAGAKAAALGDIRNRVKLPVPDGFAVTAEAYRQYCGLPLWEAVRDTTRDLELHDPESIQRVSEGLMHRVMGLPLPEGLAETIENLSAGLLRDGGSLAVRSSARGEGGTRSFAGQFLSLLNVTDQQSVDAYRRVIASRFNERALFYRLTVGLQEVDRPMASLFVKMIPARAAGILYTRDPSDPKSKSLWITATRGLGIGIASGRTPADLFVVSRSGSHAVIERNLVRKDEEIVLREGGGIAKAAARDYDPNAASMEDPQLRTLADWAVRLEEHFGEPQDIEWVLDQRGELWIVQSRPLVKAEKSRKAYLRPKIPAKLAGGRTVYPGQTSGNAFLVDQAPQIADVPTGSIVFLRKPSPEIVRIFPRIAGLVAEWGNVAGHAAALLREFQVPSVFQMTGAFDSLKNGEAVSLDAVQARVYPGILWPSSRKENGFGGRHRSSGGNPIGTRLLTLNLDDPAAENFRPAGCKSGHDILRYCHEKGIETMFAVHDFVLERDAQCARQLETPLPFNISVVDLGGGIAPEAGERNRVRPEQIVSRPFQALWKGIGHPEVSWKREMPARIGDLASILSATFTPQNGGMRPLGAKSYLLVADEYLNLNARLAYHYSLVDACLSGEPGDNYISFRFEGGGAAVSRRSLRACFLERCLVHYGFRVDRREDLVNAWFRKAPADQTGERLDVLGRLLACSSQLDMYMHSREAMNWFADQFIAGNYAFRS